MAPRWSPAANARAAPTAVAPGIHHRHGNHILDVHDLSIADPVALERELNQIAGVVSVGLFAARPQRAAGRHVHASRPASAPRLALHRGSRPFLPFAAILIQAHADFTRLQAPSCGRAAAHTLSAVFGNPTRRTANEPLQIDLLHRSGPSLSRRSLSSGRHAGAGGRSGRSAQRTVSYRDLNLFDHEGATALYQRIRHAANSVCDDPEPCGRYHGVRSSTRPRSPMRSPINSRCHLGAWRQNRIHRDAMNSKCEVERAPTWSSARWVRGCRLRAAVRPAVRSGDEPAQ